MAASRVILPSNPSRCEIFLQIVTDGSDGIDILLDFSGGSDLKLFGFVHVAKSTAVPGAVAGESDQQRKTAALTGRPVDADFKIIFLGWFCRHMVSLVVYGWMFDSFLK